MRTIKKPFVRTAIGLIAGIALSWCMLGLACPGSGGGSDGGGNTPPPNGDSGVTGKFKGATVCAQCHKNIHDGWADTLHAHALEVLESAGQGTNPDCLKCHTVGYGQDGGFVDRATPNSLAGVQCENCHGAAGDHVGNVQDPTLRPKIDLHAEVCGQCHTGDHHPNYEDWTMSVHANSIEPNQITDWSAGTSGRLTNCGKCHSGDFFYYALLKGTKVGNDYYYKYQSPQDPGTKVGDDFLVNTPSDQWLRITCAICHDPHMRTGNAVHTDEGRDYQLRFPELKYAVPTTDLNAVQDPTRFNLCGQCHHARSTTWADGSREPHPSEQTNVFFGEIPAPPPPASQDFIVVPQPSVHLNTPKLCATCHVVQKAAEPGIAPAVSGHTFAVNLLGCVQCHGSTGAADAKLQGLKVELDFRLNALLDALDAWSARPAQAGFCTGIASCWNYSSDGGPPNNAGGQGKIPDDIKKARYIYYYVKDGGGAGGVHNPNFVHDALDQAIEYATNAPDHL